MNKKQLREFAAEFCVNFCVEKKLSPKTKDLRMITAVTTMLLTNAQRHMEKYFPKNSTKGKK